MPELALVCQRRTGYVSFVERKDPERADPITRLIASRVREIRQQQRLSGAALGAAVRDLGLPGWVDSTVGKLETSRRESVTVKELFALAKALDVPPAWLLIDPSGTPVPVVEGVELDPWSALMWMIGRQVIGEPAGTNWKSEELDLLSQVQRLWETLTELCGYLHRLKTFKLGERHREMLESMIREDLDQVRECLQHIADAGAAVPQLPAEVVKRAVELGIELPGQQEVAP
jgi:transcriptional regulator with XRE-family HTH domain